jgi:hypothetical protein
MSEADRELRMIWREMSDLEAEGRFTREAYERLIRRCEALGIPRERCLHLHKAAARARLVDLDEVAPPRGTITEWGPPSTR